MGINRIDPELEGKSFATPFTLSIEPCNRPVFLHGYHLGTDPKVARQFAEEIFTRHHDSGTSLYTVALMRDGQMFDVYDGRDWFSNEMERLYETEQQDRIDAQLLEAEKAHQAPINIAVGHKDEPPLSAENAATIYAQVMDQMSNVSAGGQTVTAPASITQFDAFEPEGQNLGDLIRKIAKETDRAVTVEQAWNAIIEDYQLNVAHRGSLNMSRDKTFWDVDTSVDDHERREIAAALASGSIKFW